MPLRQQINLFHLLTITYGCLLVVLLAVVFFYLNKEKTLYHNVQELKVINEVIQSIDLTSDNFLLRHSPPERWYETLTQLVLNPLDETFTKQKSSSFSLLMPELTNKLRQLQENKCEGEGELHCLMEISALLKKHHLRLIQEMETRTLSVMKWRYLCVISFLGLTLALYLSFCKSGQLQKNMHQSFLNSQNWLSLIMGQIKDVFCLQDKESGQLLNVSPTFSSLLECNSEQLNANPFFWQERVHPCDKEKLLNAFDLPPGAEGEVDFRWISPSGTTRWMRQSVKSILVEGGVAKDSKTLLFTSVTDITECKLLSAHLEHVQRLGVLGQMTGGVVHDFNNLLTVIMSNAQLIEAHAEHSSPFQSMAALIAKAAKRGASLNHRLLTFAGEESQIDTINVSELLSELSIFLSENLGDGIVLNMRCSQADIFLQTDGAQLQNALINLCFNARDAMPNGGCITISVTQEELDGAVVICVSDTGCGIASHQLPHIFKPFYTTKHAKGSGLGLSTLYDYMKKSHGEVNVTSEVGVGTTFCLIFSSAKFAQRTNSERG